MRELAIPLIASPGGDVSSLCQQVQLLKRPATQTFATENYQNCTMPERPQVEDIQGSMSMLCVRLVRLQQDVHTWEGHIAERAGEGQSEKPNVIGQQGGREGVCIRVFLK